MKNKFIFLWIGLISVCSFGQDWQNHNWIFGDSNMLQVENPVITQTTVPITFQGQDGTASVSDRLGRLLMFTDSENLWYHSGSGFSLATNYSVLSGFLGRRLTSQNALFIPVPEDPEQDSYYLITLSGHKGVTPTRRGLYWSKIDLIPGTISAPVALLDQAGDVIDSTYFNDSEAMTTTLHPSGGYWLLAHIQEPVKGNANLLAYRVTSAGIGALIPGRPDSYTPLSIPQNPTHPSVSPYATSIKVSRDRTHFAMGSSDAGIYIGNFNDATGSYTNINNFTYVITSGQDYVHGIEFSWDSDYLYFTGGSSIHNVAGIGIPLVTTPTFTISPNASPGTTYRGLQLGRDKKIYVSCNGNTSLGVINSPADLATFPTTTVTLTNDANRGLPQWVWKQHCEPILVDDDDIPPGFPTVFEQRSDRMELTNLIHANSITPALATTRAIYHAANLVELLPEDPANGINEGFEAAFGSEFVAYIAPCDDTAPFDDDFVYRHGHNVKPEKVLPPSLLGKIKVYPNPTDSSVSVASDALLNRITVLSMDGKIMFDQIIQSKLQEINVSHFSKGIYLISVQTDDGQTRQSKFVKN